MIASELPGWPAVDFAAFGEVEVKPLSRIQGLTAGFLARNWLSIPHVTHQDDVDITALEVLRRTFEPKPSALGFFAKALVSALRAFPQFNASLDASAKSLVLGALSAHPASPEELAEIRGMLDAFANEKGRSE